MKIVDPATSPIGTAFLQALSRRVARDHDHDVVVLPVGAVKAGELKQVLRALEKAHEQ
jgi:hypothetical protein